MSKKLNTIAILIFVYFFFSRCDLLFPPKYENHKIIGSWFWLETFGGFAPTRTTPETTGYTIISVFEEDGTYKEYKNNKLYRQATFKISYENIWGDQKKEEILQKGSSIFKQAIYFFGKDTLLLRDTCIDCNDYKYP